MESTSPKQRFNQASSSPLLLIFITLLGLAGGLAYIAHQLQGLEAGETPIKNYSSIQNKLEQIQAELHDLDERMDEQHGDRGDFAAGDVGFCAVEGHCSVEVADAVVVCVDSGRLLHVDRDVDEFVGEWFVERAG